jgi:type IV secretory pathway VirB2 component (pilin)
LPNAAQAAVCDYLLSTLDKGARSELLHMMGLVAAIVAIVILVFFGLGYLFGRLFL